MKSEIKVEAKTIIASANKTYFKNKKQIKKKIVAKSQSVMLFRILTLTLFKFLSRLHLSQ